MESSMLKKYIEMSKELNAMNQELVNQNKNIQLKKIVNGIFCLECHTAAFTFSNHDFKKCECGKNGIDGGLGGTFRKLGNTHSWIPAFVIQNKKERKKNPLIQNKTMELMNFVQKIS